MFIFLDESGNFAGDNGGVFIVGGFLTADQRATAKAFRKWQQTKFFNQKLRYRTEVKFSDARLTDELRAKTLQYLAKQNLRVFYSFLKTENIPVDYRDEHKIKSGHLYAEVVAKTLDLLFPVTDPEFRLFLDRRRLKRLSQPAFRESLRTHIAPSLSPRAVVQIETVDSVSSTNIQIADWICGALYRHHTGREFGQTFYDILHASIVAEKELFKDYWQENANKKSPPKG